MGFLYQLIQNAITAYTLILVAYALLSWFPGAYQTAFGRWLEKLSHPYLKLFYPLNLRLGMMDFTVLVAILVLRFVGSLLIDLLFGFWLW